MDIYVARLGCSLASVSVAASSLRVQKPSCDTDTVFKNATASGANKPAGSHICRENTGRRQEKKGEKGKGAKRDWMVLSAHSYGSNPKNLNSHS